MPGQDSHFTHFDAAGQAHMVDVARQGGNASVSRARRAASRCCRATLETIRAGTRQEGRRARHRAHRCDPGGQAHRRTHSARAPAAADARRVDFAVDATGVTIEVTAETLDRTGVEMEALTAVAVGLLTIYDMCKSVDRGMRIEEVRLLEKSGGKSGHFKAA